MSSIAVFGSLNVDLVTRMDQFPQPGETVVARSFVQYSGGKGANQAVACGRLGASVSMFGALGKDTFANNLLHSLGESNVNTEDLLFSEDTPSGMAHIWVDAQGENSIAILPGANARLDLKYVDTVLPKIRQFSWLLMQLEVPIDTMTYLLEELPSDSPKVILDPAPTRSLESLPTEHLWLLTPNEHELKSLTGSPIGTSEEIRRACRSLLHTTGAKAVLCKAGNRGSYLDNGDEFRHFPGYSVHAVDSTAAGDAFNGTLAAALSEGQPLEKAIQVANAAGAFCVTRAGAQQSMPWRKELDMFLRTQNQHLD